MVGFVAIAETDISAPPARVWSALTDRTRLNSTSSGPRWRPTGIQACHKAAQLCGRASTRGAMYEDKGQIIEAEPGHRLVVSHFSPMSGRPNVPENYHTITYVLEPRCGQTHLTLTQDNVGAHVIT